MPGFFLEYVAWAMILGDTAELGALARRLGDGYYGSAAEGDALDGLELQAVIGLARSDPELRTATKRLMSIRRAPDATLFDIRRAAVLGLNGPSVHIWTS